MRPSEILLRLKDYWPPKIDDSTLVAAPHPPETIYVVSVRQSGDITLLKAFTDAGRASRYCTDIRKQYSKDGQPHVRVEFVGLEIER
jgi:hypothetical protein